VKDLIVLVNARLATMAGDASDDALGIVEQAAMVIEGDRIVWLGKENQLPQQWRAQATLDLAGRWITPGLIDCHTHLIYAGDRAFEWQRRLEGESYASIASQGGGIAASVRATRAASQQALVESTVARLRNWQEEGVTTVEIKSGYGLDLEDELKMLRAARQVAAQVPLTVRTTFLGAHAVPPEFKGRPDDYLDLVVDEMLPAIAGEQLADAVDVFCEHLAFSVAQSERVLEKAMTLGLAVKVHADQLSDSGGSLLAARYHALSADHLEYTPKASVEAMAHAGVVAVLLPAAFYSMAEKQLPPIAEMRAAGLAIALATDHNPGTSPCSSLLLVLNMACNLFRMTPAEALLGVTRHAAKALGLSDGIGQLAPGFRADLAIWDVGHVRELCYAFGARPLAASMFEGRWIKALSL
jgi:imidazolonepropionase